MDRRAFRLAFPVGLVLLALPLALIPLVAGGTAQAGQTGAAERLSRAGWTATADSVQPGPVGRRRAAPARGRAANVLDGNRATLWITRFSPFPVPRHPHWIAIDTKRVQVISGLVYQPRTTRSRLGNVGRYRIHVSRDGRRWNRPVASGTFADTRAGQTIRFAPVRTRHVRLLALTEAGGRGPWSSAAEIHLLGAPRSAPPAPAPPAPAVTAIPALAGPPRIAAGNGVGAWGPTIGFPLVPAAAALLPGGRVLTWSAWLPNRFGGAGAGRTETATLDLGTGQVSQRTVTETGHDMFCPGTSLMADGRLIVTGGNSARRTSIYQPGTGGWTRGPDTVVGRGYQSTTLLSDGRVFSLGGSWSGGIGGKNGEVYADGQGWSRMDSVPSSTILTADSRGEYRSDNHGWFFATSDGGVFHAGPSRRMNWFRTTGGGGVVPAGVRGDDGDAMNGNAVMYDVNRILTVGGAANYEQAAEASAGAFDIDISGGFGTAPTVRRVGSMAEPRAFHNSVVLPDGRVLVVGGMRSPKVFSDAGASLTPELWDPTTGRFSRMAPMAVPRTYHSVALLLPDGRVFSGGGGLCNTCAVNHPDGQIFAPPYLFKADGSPAARPRILSAPAQAAPGGTLPVTTDVPVSGFSLVRFSSVTHTVNTDQRRIPLAGSGGTGHSLRIPGDRGVVLPGPYMLFALNEAGVPSVAATVMIG